MQTFREFLTEQDHHIRAKDVYLKKWGSRAITLRDKDTVSKSGKKVIFAKGSTWFYGHTKQQHAVLFRNTIFAGVIHADAVDKLLTTFGGRTKKEREKIANIIDDGIEPVSFGYYYDQEFHEDPDPNTPGMDF